MKYQKSMMKIMENLLYNRNEERSIESIIRETKTGRNSSFNALKWLEKNGLIKIKKRGNQKTIKPIIDNYTLQFKYYLDSIAFKTLDPFLKLIINVFISGILNKTKIKSAVLFGSALKKEEFNDIDILLLGKGLNIKDIESLSDLRDKIERLFGVIINLHKDELILDNVFRGIVIYQSSYLNIRDKIQEQYLEFLDFGLEAVRNQNDIKTFQTALDNSVLNLSYTYCYLNNFMPETKSDAIEFFNKKYKINNINELKKTGVEIGKEVFK